MADLKNMTGTEAFQLAKDESALTTDEIAERLNVSPSVIKRYLKSGDSYLPGLEMLPGCAQCSEIRFFSNGWKHKSNQRKSLSLRPKAGRKY